MATTRKKAGAARVGTPPAGPAGGEGNGRAPKGEAPQPKKLRFTLPESGEDVRITITQGSAVLHRKITVDGRHVRAARPAKAKPGETPRRRPYLTHPVTVPALFLELRRPGKPPVKVRSCCKPPDQFVRKVGLEMAVGRLLPLLEGLGHKDRSFVRYQVLGGPPAKKRLATAGEASGAVSGTLPGPEAEGAAAGAGDTRADASAATATTGAMS